MAAANYRWARDGRMYADLKSQYATLTAKMSLDKVDITSITSHYTFKQTDLNNVSGEAYPASFTQLADFNQTAEEVRFQTKFEGPFNALFGVFVSDSRFVFNTDAYIFPVPLDAARGTFVTFRRDNGFKGDSVSAFAELTYNFSERWELAGGARALAARDVGRELPGRRELDQRTGGQAGRREAALAGLEARDVRVAAAVRAHALALAPAAQRPLAPAGGQFRLEDDARRLVPRGLRLQARFRAADRDAGDAARGEEGGRQTLARAVARAVGGLVESAVVVARVARRSQEPGGGADELLEERRGAI